MNSLYSFFFSAISRELEMTQQFKHFQATCFVSKKRYGPILFFHFSALSFKGKESNM